MGENGSRAACPSTAGFRRGALFRRVRLVAARLGFGDRRRARSRHRPAARHFQTRPDQSRPRFSGAFGSQDRRESIAGMWDNLGRVAAEYPHLRKIRVFDAGRPRRDARLRAYRPGGRGGTPHDHLLRPHRQLGDRHAGRGPIRDLGRADLSRRQQSAGRPDDHAVSRGRRRADPEGQRRRPARHRRAPPRRASDDARRPENERRHSRAVLRPTGDDHLSPRRSGAALRLRRIAGARRAARGRAFPAHDFSAAAAAAQRRSSRRCRRPDDAGQSDPGGMDLRPPRSSGSGSTGAGRIRLGEAATG